MNRRSFLKRFAKTSAVAAVAVAVAPKVLLSQVETQSEVIGEYTTYANFSNFALAQYLDKEVEAAALELGHRAAMTMHELNRAVFA
jgi:hypothetical protein